MDVGLVCDACSALTPIGVPQCERCGEPVALDPRPTRATRPAASAPAGTPCPACEALLAPDLRICPRCGQRVPSVTPQAFEVETRVGPRPGGPSSSIPGVSMNVPATAPGSSSGRSTLFFGGAVQAARAKLTLIRGDGEDGVSFTLAGQDHHAGRGECPISFPDDPFLSPTHANFLYRVPRPGAPAELVVRDEGSLNGVYVRIQAPTTLRSGASILVGEQVLTIELARQPDDVPDSTGTYYSASMPRAASVMVTQHLRGGAAGWVYRLDAEQVVLGREGNDINFPEDPYISGRHAELRVGAGVLSLTDLGSRNGTFVRVSGEQVLRHGDYVFLGQQLLRVEIV